MTKFDMTNKIGHFDFSDSGYSGFWRSRAESRKESVES
jgi:hypothetical protein